MSWDVLVQNFRGNPPEGDDWETEPEPLGASATIRRRIDKHLPGVVWSDALHGVFEGDAFSIEFDISDEKPIMAIVLSVRGGGKAFEALKSFAKPNQWSLFDCSESAFLDLESPTAEGFEAFREYRDRSIAKKRAQGKPTKSDASKRKRKPKQA